MSGIFKAIPDAVAIIRKGGVFKQVPMFRRKERVYVQYGSGYAWVSEQGTSVSGLIVDEVIMDERHTYSYDKLGRMVLRDL